MAQRRRVYRRKKETDREQLPRTKTYSRESASHTLDSLTIQKARLGSDALKLEEVPRLQHTIGNQATGRPLDNSSAIGSSETVVQQQGSRSRSMSEGALPRPMDSSSPEVTRYTDPKVAQRLNQMLRKGKLPEYGTVECKLYENLIRSLIVGQGQTLVYRGLNIGGNEIRSDENGFMSTSKGNPYGGDTLLILNVSQVARADIENLSHFGIQWEEWLPERNEQEVLVQPMTRLEDKELIKDDEIKNLGAVERKVVDAWMKKKGGKKRIFRATVIDRSKLETPL